jgi:hypothetical protein
MHVQESRTDIGEDTYLVSYPRFYRDARQFIWADAPYIESPTLLSTMREEGRVVEDSGSQPPGHGSHAGSA